MFQMDREVVLRECSVMRLVDCGDQLIFTERYLSTLLFITSSTTELYMTIRKVNVINF